MVAAMINSALEALLRHDSVRALNGESRQNAALKEHNGTEALRGASWNPTRQRWRAQIYYPGRTLHLGYFQHEEHAAKAHDLMAIKLRGMQAPLNFVPETYNDMYKLLARVDQVLLIELLQSFSRTRNKLLVESARQQQRMAWEASIDASDPTMGTDWEDAAPTATTLPCQPSHPLAPHSAAGCGMAMGDDVATRFDAALDQLLLHASVRAPSNLNRLMPGRQHNGAGGLCGASWNKAERRWTAQITHRNRTLHLGSFQCGEHAAKVHDLMAIKLRGMHAALNFVSKTYNDMYELLAQVKQPLLIQLLRAFGRNNKKLLAVAARQPGSTIQEAALTAPDPAMHPDWSNASCPTATTLPRQAGQPLAPPCAAAGDAQCSVEALGWPCDAAGSEAAASLPPSKRPRRSAMAVIGSAPLGSSAQGTSTGRCPSAAAVCADTTASNTNALGMTLPAAPQLVGVPGVSLGVSKGRARPAGRGWAEADALWEQAEQVHEGGGGDGEAMSPGSSHATAGQDCDAQENNQVGRLLPDAGSNVWYPDSSEWGPRWAEPDVAGHAVGGQYTRAVEEEACEGQPAMNPASWSPSIQATRQPAVSSYRQRLQLLLCQQRCAAPSECAASAAASWDD